MSEQWCFIRADFVDEMLAEQRAGGLPKQGYDLRIFHCPECGGPGLNSLLGSIRFQCGAEIVGDEMWRPCSAAQRARDKEGE